MSDSSLTPLDGNVYNNSNGGSGGDYGGGGDGGGGGGGGGFGSGGNENHEATPDYMLSQPFANYMVTTTTMPLAYEIVVTCYVGLVLVWMLYLVLSSSARQQYDKADDNDGLGGASTHDEKVDATAAAPPPLTTTTAVTTSSGTALDDPDGSSNNKQQDAKVIPLSSNIMSSSMRDPEATHHHHQQQINDDLVPKETFTPDGDNEESGRNGDTTTTLLSAATTSHLDHGSSSAHRRRSGRRLRSRGDSLRGSNSRRQQRNGTQGGNGGGGGGGGGGAGGGGGNSSNNMLPLRIWDVANLRWKHDRPVGRIADFQRSVQAERQFLAAAVLSDDDGSHGMGAGDGANKSRAANSWASKLSHRSKTSSKNTTTSTSQVASRVLQEQQIEGEADFYRQKYLQRHFSRPSRGPMSSASSVTSRLPGLSADALSPEDAADAHDPGRISGLDQKLHRRRRPAGYCRKCWDGFWDLSEPDLEMRRVLQLSLPSTLGAVADPVFRLVLVCMISHWINSRAGIAFVLASLFLRLSSEEVASALADAQTTILHSLVLEHGTEDSFVLAGSWTQLAMLIQTMLIVPLLVMWIFVMEDTVNWLVGDTVQDGQGGVESIGALARDYTKVIAVTYVLQSITRAFMMIFHIMGQAAFEKYVDLCSTMITVLCVGVVIGPSDDMTLVTVAWIQVIVGIAKAVVKVVYVIAKGWLKPYRRGLLCLASPSYVRRLVLFLRTALPLLVGSMIELREWELLVFFAQELGSAETAAWALMGILWEICEAFTEGLGEAAAVRTSFYLAESSIGEAKRLCNKIVMLTFVGTLLFLSIFFMVGPNLAVALTTDDTVQLLFDDLVGFTGMAMVAVSFAQVHWSVAGAQGRFLLGSSSILFGRWCIAIPLAALVVFLFDYELRAMAGAIALGYSSAAAFLAFQVYRSDWNAIALLLQETPLANEALDASLSEQSSVYDDEDGGEDDDSDDKF